jgi:hypothetical protein
MKLLVGSQAEASAVCNMLQGMCEKIRHNRDIPDVLQQGYMDFLYVLRNSVEVTGEES